MMEMVGRVRLYVRVRGCVRWHAILFRVMCVRALKSNYAGRGSEDGHRRDGLLGLTPLLPWLRWWGLSEGAQHVAHAISCSLE